VNGTKVDFFNALITITNMDDENRANLLANTGYLLPSADVRVAEHRAMVGIMELVLQSGLLPHASQCSHWAVEAMAAVDMIPDDTEILTNYANWIYALFAAFLAHLVQADALRPLPA
jgi:hypothetical protein